MTISQTKVKSQVTSSSAKEPSFGIVIKTIPSPVKRFAPICKKCGKEHWPLAPSCIGKRAAKAEARAKAKEKARAKAEAKAKAKAEKKARAKAEKRTKAEAKAEEKTAATNECKESAGDRVSEIIRKMTPSTVVLPEEHPQSTVVKNPALNSTSALLAICAKDIMQKDVVWGSSDDSIQQVLTKMEQHDVSYMMIGRNGVLESVVSKSDLTGAISPCLQPVLAKWRQPSGDDATLQLKIKWIIARPVHTISPETSFAAIMKNMRQSGWRALPVMDQQGKIQGLVTVFNVFKIRALLKLESNPSVSTAGKLSRVPQLV